MSESIIVQTAASILLNGMAPNSNNSTSMHPMHMYFSSESFQPYYKYILFEGWNADTDWKYALSFIGVFLLALVNQSIYFSLHFQVDAEKRRILHYFVSYLIKPAGFFVELSIGYLLMLVSMTYNFGLFMAIVVGNFIGYIIFQMFITELLDSKKVQKEDLEKQALMRSCEQPKKKPCCCKSENKKQEVYVCINKTEK